MKALLRADWLRLRRRKDLWIVAIAVCVIGLVSFIGGYRADATDPYWLTMTEAQIREEVQGYGGFEGLTQAEIDEQINFMVVDRVTQAEQERVSWEANQLITLQKYGFPQSVFTVVGNGIIPLVALLLISSLAIGDEFRFGTIRTSLLAASHRRRFLAARLGSLLALTVGLFALQVLLGAVLGVLLRLIGADLGANSISVDAGSAVALLGGQLLITMTLIALATAVTLLLRFGALTLLLILIGGLVELFVANLPIFGPGELLSGVPQVFLVQSIRTLSAVLGLDTHAIALSEAGQMPYQAIAIPMFGVAAIIAAWGALFVVIADRRLRTMDIVE
jgi:hypothetical protein